MERKIIIAKLVELANTLDSKGFTEEAKKVDELIQQANKIKGISELTSVVSEQILHAFCQWMRNQIDFFEMKTKGKTVTEALKSDKILDETLLYYLEIIGFDVTR